MAIRNPNEDARQKIYAETGTITFPLSTFTEEEKAARPDPDWAYNEGALIEELREYCAKTYNEHYADDIQSGEFISAKGHGVGFFLGNVIKYAGRYGKKDGYNRKDLMKILHYGIMAIWEHDKNEK